MAKGEKIASNAEYDAFLDGRVVKIVERESGKQAASIDLDDAGQMGLGNFTAFAVDRAREIEQQNSSGDGGSGVDEGGQG